MVKGTRRKNKYTMTAPKAKAGPSLGRWLSGFFWAASGLAIIAAMSLVCIFSYDWVTQCAYFQADAVEVTGTERLDADDIKSIAGVSEGVNILSVNLSSSRKRLAAEPWIKDASISRKFPSKMTIDIREHNALAVMDFERLFMIDTSGCIFAEYDSSDPASLPVVSGLSYKDWTAKGFRETRAFNALMRILHLCNAAGSTIPNRNIEKIIVDQEIGLTLKTREPVQFVELGFEQYEDKLERFEKIAAHLEEKELENVFSRVDLKNPDRIVARPVSGKNIVAGKGGSSEGT